MKNQFLLVESYFLFNKKTYSLNTLLLIKIEIICSEILTSFTSKLPLLFIYLFYKFQYSLGFLRVEHIHLSMLFIRKILKVMHIFSILIVVMASYVCAYA